LLVGLLFLLYSASGHFSPTAGFIAFAIIMAIAPALLKSSMQFRLANTSWRGLRYRFTGSTPDAYRAVLPLLVPTLLMSASAIGAKTPDSLQLNRYLIIYTLVAVGTLLTLPWLFWNLKKYQHNNYALASLQTRFKAPVAAFYKLFFKLTGTFLLIGTFIAACGYALFKSRVGLNLGSAGSILLLGLLPLMLLMLILMGVKPYLLSRIQNIIWTQTGNSNMRFISQLGFKSVLLLTIKNWLLMMLTLGLYWPFATVAMTRLRLEAVQIKTRIDPSTLFSQLKAVQGDVAGDAAGDLFGIDLGL
jgi:uncharacterized membrane protein YjgN (DUF898 family)